jgi:hypothetical protein
MLEGKTMEKKGREGKVHAFPELVYREFLAVLVAFLVLMIWSHQIDAPLRSIADPNWTENPAKAPWYFVGLQEMLVYFDPWIAGVTMPLLIIVGLVLIPYLDPNPKGLGEYNFRDRRLIVTVFLFGYFLWFGLILVGYFLRGPNWQFYWPWEDWSIQKDAEQALMNLPGPLGLAIIAGSFAIGIILPALLGKSLFKKMGILKHLIAWSIVWLMLGVVAKMILRIFFHVKYIFTTSYFSI